MMLKRRKKKGGDVPVGTDYCDVNCPRCGHFHSRVKRKRKYTEKLAFECKKCTGRWTLTFPGDEQNPEVEAWLRGDSDSLTTARLPFFKRWRL